MNSLSIILPAHNEEGSVKRVIENVSLTVSDMVADYEIILVNDGSTDRTKAIANKLCRSIPELKIISHYPSRHYGGTLKAGFSVASKEWVTFFPADGQFDFMDFARLMEVSSEADIVCGYRINRRDHFVRKINAYLWNCLVRFLFGPLCRDIDCGFKLFRRDILDTINLQSDGALIDTELLVCAKLSGFTIREAGLPHHSRKEGNATGANPMVIIKALLDLLRFRIEFTLKQKSITHDSIEKTQNGR